MTFIKRHKKGIIALAVVLAILISLSVAALVYVNDYYRADAEAIERFTPKGAYPERVLSDGTVVIEPEGATACLVFYPGGKVEHLAYLPLMRLLADRGIATALVKMPCRLAVLGKNRAERVMEQMPEIKHWYVGGHSLGGSMAASFASGADGISGVVLLAAYSTSDLSSSGIRVLSVYGDRDGVLNMEKYEKYKENLPDDLAENVIHGANHAGFGMYGRQDGDGAAEMPVEDQISETANYISQFILLEVVLL